MPTILHFADAHIDMANYGRHDPQSGLPMRVVDFLKSLDKSFNQDLLWVIKLYPLLNLFLKKMNQIWL